MKKVSLFFMIAIFCLVLFCNCFAVFDHDRAVVYSQEGAWDKAHEKMQALMVENHTSPIILYDTGVTSCKQGNFEQACACFEQACAQVSVTSAIKEQAFFNAGNAYIKLNKIQEAIRSYESCLQCNPENQYAAHNLEKAKELLKEQEQKQQEQKQEQQDQKSGENKKDSQKDQAEQHQENSQEKEKEQSDQADQQQGDKDQKDQNQQESDQDNKGDGQQDTHNASGHQSGNEQKQQDVHHDTAPQAPNQPDNQAPRNNQPESSSQPRAGEQSPADTQSQTQNTQETQSKQGGIKQDDMPAWVGQLLQKQQEADQKTQKKLMKAMIQGQSTDKRAVGKHEQNSW